MYAPLFARRQGNHFHEWNTQRRSSSMFKPESWLGIGHSCNPLAVACNGICGRIWEKGPYSVFSEFAYSNAYIISETIAAMNLKLGMNILPSSCYTNYALRVLPTSGVGGANAHVDRIQKSSFYASLGQLTSQDRRLAVASNVGSVK